MTAKALQVGDKAPDFTLPDQDGKPVSLKDFAGKKLVLYFYPKDNTPGCTREACAFKENIAAFNRIKTAVLGVSPDSSASHIKFIAKYELNFPLLADTERAVSTAYGVFKEKLMYGKKVMGIERTTFIIDEKGRIEKIFPKVKVDGHIEQVLAALK